MSIADEINTEVVIADWQQYIAQKTEKTIYITKTTIAQTGERAWEAEWFTDVSRDKGVRIVTLRVSHHQGFFTVTASIATAVADYHFKVRQFALFKDPMITLTKQRARFSQKRLKEMFDGFYDHFDVEAFYAAHEVEDQR